MKYSDEEILGTRSGRDISPQFELECQEVICSSLIKLMTEKGIYQNINIDLSKAISSGIDKLFKKVGQYSYEDLIYEFDHRPWQPVSRGLGSNLHHDIRNTIANQPLGTDVVDLYLNFYLPDFNTRCSICDKETTHYSMISSARNFLENIESLYDNFLKQFFVFHYKCGICKENIISFLITRYKNKVTLCGRSERLNYEIDSIIPKKLRPIINDAISSANENDVYAGFYHLRTFIEHFVKNLLGIKIDLKIRGDELLDKYHKELGSKISSQIPSLGAIYSELSNNVHQRLGSKEDFDSYLIKIIDHLKAKDLFDKYS